MVRSSEVPNRIGRYRIDGQIGGGSMGVVYRGRDLEIDRDVALKTIHRHLLESEPDVDWRARFRREMQLAARVSHPSIVTIYDYLEFDGAPFIAMEYLEGPSLARHIESRQAVDVGLGLRVGFELLSALGAAHAVGIVHRDVKPSNIILCHDGRAKLGDFGVARTEASALTAVGSAIGTPGYMAPEQFRGGEIDGRADLFAAAVVLYEFFTGRLPFAGEHSPEILYRIMFEAPAPLDGPAGPMIEAVLQRALAKDPADRFQTAAEFAAALRAAAPRPSEIRGASLDATVVAGLANLPPSRLDLPAAPAAPAGAPAGLPADAFSDTVERELAVFVGPIAKVLVTRHRASAASRRDLVERVSAAALSGAEAIRFRARFAGTGIDDAPVAPAAAPRPAAPAGTLTLGERETAGLARTLASYIGPIAELVVNQALLKSRSREEFYARVAETIPSKAERDDFLKRLCA